MRRSFIILCLFLCSRVQAQTVREFPDSLVLSNGRVTVTVHTFTGKTDYRLEGGIRLNNTIAYMEDLHYGYMSTADATAHPYSTDVVSDSLGKGIRVNIKHTDETRPLYLLQHITLYENLPYVLTDVEAGRNTSEGPFPETRNISPMAILPSMSGKMEMPGAETRILDVPFDNDDWVGVVERRWKKDTAIAGISYELCSVYDNVSLAGLVLGSLKHDFWKTGIVYHTGSDKGLVDSCIVYGGAATPDNFALPHAYGGQDGTHDHAPHGTQLGATVCSPLLFVGGGTDVRQILTAYGATNVRINGRLTWKGYAPFYWNSFGVEGVLGYEKVMMPPGVQKISDFISTLDNFNRYAPPVLSIDSYDQTLYTTELLASLGRYGKKHRQQMGFYFTPFTVWTWKNALDQTMVPGTDYPLNEVILKDVYGKPITYKDGDWGAFPLDPTHPATRQTIIRQLQKAKAIDARFIKIDFLPGGALESATRYDPSIRSGMQAFNYGMKMLKHLIDSIMGPDIFITEAIAPLFPSQYAHTRFNSTDVYSHLRDDEPGFPNWGSTEAGLATGSHMWWVQGTLWPYTNMDVTIMKNFQKNHDLSEQEIKVRIYSMIVMGSILGDGSDFRQPLAAERAMKFLNNRNVCAFFSQPKAFTPQRFADGESYDQQLSFFLPAGSQDKESPALAAVFNFNGSGVFQETFRLQNLGLKPGRYVIRDFITDERISSINAEQTVFQLSAGVKDASLVKIVRE